MNIITKQKLISQILLGFAVLMVTIAICMALGPEQASLTKALTSAPDSYNVDFEIIFKIRLPRIILAALVGAALGCSGAVLQAILKNPLADPYILGISSGAGLGVMIAILLNITWSFLAGAPVTIFAFVGALVTVWLVWFIGHLAGRAQVTSLLLAGVVVNAFFSAVIMFLTFMSKSERVYSTIYWLMGNITDKSPLTLAVSSIFIILGIIGLISLANRLNVLTLGRTQATSLGIDVFRTRLIAFALAAFITAVAVSLSGLIGFVGLIVPHAVRLVFGPDHRRLLPLSALIAAASLVIADTFARIIVSPAQLPVGIVTAIVGGPFFLILLTRYSRKVSWLK